MHKRNELRRLDLEERKILLQEQQFVQQQQQTNGLMDKFLQILENSMK